MKKILMLVVLAAVLFASCEVVPEAPEPLFTATANVTFNGFNPTTNDHYELWLITESALQDVDSEAEFRAAAFKVAEQSFSQTGDHSESVTISSTETAGGTMVLFVFAYLEGQTETAIFAQESRDALEITDGGTYTATFQYRLSGAR